MKVQIKNGLKWLTLMVLIAAANAATENCPNTIGFGSVYDSPNAYWSDNAECNYTEYSSSCDKCIWAMDSGTKCTELDAYPVTGRTMVFGYGYEGQCVGGYQEGESFPVTCYNTSEEGC